MDFHRLACRRKDPLELKPFGEMIFRNETKTNKQKTKKTHIRNTNTLVYHPIRVVEQGNYHVIVVIGCSGVQHPMISMPFFFPTEYPSILYQETYHVIVCKITWQLPCSTTLKDWVY